jgi:hypothetical protein
MSKYTVRITNDVEGINAWIDQDGRTCIKQSCAPDKTGQWETEAEALAWADTHAAELEASYEAGLAATALREEREAAQHAANLAMVALLERLTNPSA